MRQRFASAALFGLLVALPACGNESPSPSLTDPAGSGGTTSVFEGGDAAGGASEDASGGDVETDEVDAAAEADGGTGCEPGTFYALEAQSLDRQGPVSMCEFRGKVVLVSNIAAKCGYTPQLGVLAALQGDYLDAGLVILGFYSNQFGSQAGSEEERDICQEKYRVTFEVFDVVNVNPPDEHPIFGWLKSQDGFEGDVKWNFEKFLLSRDGRLIGRWDSAVEPDSAAMTSAIEAALAEPPP